MYPNITVCYKKIIYIYIHLFNYTNIYVCVYVHINTYIYIYIYMYIFIHLFIRPQASYSLYVWSLGLRAQSQPMKPTRSSEVLEKNQANTSKYANQWLTDPVSWQSSGRLLPVGSYHALFLGYPIFG